MQGTVYSLKHSGKGASLIMKRSFRGGGMGVKSTNAGNLFKAHQKMAGEKSNTIDERLLTALSDLKISNSPKRTRPHYIKL